MNALRFLATALILAFFSISAAGAAVAPRGQVFRIDSAEDCRRQGVDVAALTGGGFVSVWTGHATPGLGGGTRIWARLFADDGSPLGPDFLVSSGTTGGQETAAIAAGAEGRFLIVWRDLVRREVVGRLFAPNGTPLGEDFRVSSPGDGYGPDVVATPEGFAVAWATGEGIELRTYDENGAAGRSIDVGGELFPSSGNYSRVSLSTSPTGDLALAWAVELTGFFPLSSAVGVAAVRAQGDFVQGYRIPAGTLADRSRWTTFEIISPNGGLMSAPRVGMRTDGSVVTVWKEENQRPLGLFAEVLDASGELGPVRRLDEGNWSRLGEPDLLSDPDGGFVVSWDGALAAGSDQGFVLARSFGEDGTAVGPAVVLAEGGEHGREGTALTRLFYGDLIAVWHEGVIPELQVLDPCIPTAIEGRRLSAGCLPGSSRLCLGDNGRFQLEVSWSAVAPTGTNGPGRPVRISRDTGYFWFFDDQNVELMVKVLDGRVLNGRYWVFYGSLSDVNWTLRVTDTLTGVAKTYRNASGQLASSGDTWALPGAAAAASATGTADTFEVRAFEAIPVEPQGSDLPAAGEASPCTDPAPGVERQPGLCLQARGFEVEVDWTNPFTGVSGAGRGVGLTDDSGYFWFFDPANVELVVKVLDGRAINGKHWVFYGALTNVEYTVKVRQLSTGAEKTYHNPPFQFLSRADTAAF